MNVNWASIKLCNGFGYWNKRGELVLHAMGDAMASKEEDDERFVRRFYCDCNGGNNDDDEEHFNDKGYDGNNYPFFSLRVLSQKLEGT